MEEYRVKDIENFRECAKAAFELMRTQKRYPAFAIRICTDYALNNKILPDYDDWLYVAEQANYKKAWAYLQVDRYIELAKSKGFFYKKPEKPMPKPKEPKPPKIEWF